ncbi:MAG TPA: penicillin-binding protein 2 [Candidatus Saccharicenans sp.]|jgi:penicillin-binding protein 2|nr:penicillin-binding protein 2 [Candidatus Saccharicenans sp.]HQE63754.1 penicillin-binding protein 2 [Candidatus Saccharicenans sp.]HQH60306.1 penicillin-binding protein 2 [Candidatus Saccharicenans sp.]HQI21602.1 penicillin-binding protein 2 [Candidatus Saccharicenans sp.]
MAKIYEDLSQLIKRSRLTLIIFSLILFLILAFYWKIQILDHQKYWKMAEANRLRSLPLPAPRGLIYDRQRIILADNQPSFKVSLLRESIKNDSQTIERVSQLLNLKTEELKARIDRYRWLQTYGPVIIKDNLKLEEVALIEARREEFPELQLQVEPRRYYPFETTAAHVLGYLQEVSPEEMKGNPHKKWRGGEMIGKAAVEKQYDDYLTGQDGQLLETVDSLGRSLGEVNRIEPIKGQDLVLSIDLDLQKKAEGLLEGKEGAIIVLDSGSGECLAWVSSPSYDPNRFITRFSPEEWLSIINDPARPLENRVIRGQYSPGSIFKVVTALTSLETGLITDRTAFFCSGSINLYGKDFACWFKPGHGLLSLPEALKNSCNIYFYQLGRRLNVDTIARYARTLGLGQITGVDMPGEKEGLIPSSDWKKKTQGEAWYPGETISVAIGQGPVLVTPLQVAALTACLANRGIRVKPRVTRLEGKMGPVKDKTGINPETFEKIIEGMWRSVNDGGTGHGAYQPGFDICGKTGSTQVISREKAERMIKRGEEPAKTHSWFTGFAPRYQPQVVVTVLVEFGGMGGQTAAPIAGEMFKLYREKYVRQTNLQGN